MRAPFYMSGGDVVHSTIGCVPANAVTDAFENLECRRESALAAGKPATAEWLRIQTVSLTMAVVAASDWKRASGGMRA